MSNASRSVNVFPAPVNITIIPYPAGYPSLPLNTIQYQPTAYTQATSSVAFVTVLLPVVTSESITAPSVIIASTDDKEVTTFEYNIVISTNSGSQQADGIALLSFSFLLGGITNYKIVVNVNNVSHNDTGDPLGKVVMDSNMEPTLPNS